MPTITKGESSAIQCNQPDAINAVENGKFDPSLSLAFSIADAFELSIEDVFQREDE